MPSMTIRNRDDQLKAKIRVSDAQHGRSMEDEARDILRAALSTEAADAMIAAVTHSRGAVLATGNVRNFADCEIDIVNPWGNSD